jgi:hypothetical protein
MKGGKIGIIKSFRKYFKIIFSVIIFFVFFSSIILIENFTNPPSQIYDYKMNPISYDSFNLSNKTYPEYFNEEDKGLRVTFEMLPGEPLSISPGFSPDVYFGISYFNLTNLPLYTYVTFHIINANFSIGSYSTNSWYLNYYDNLPILWIHFKLGPSITLYDKEGKNYSGEGFLTVVPVIHYGPFHIGKAPFLIHFNTSEHWYYIQRASTSIVPDKSYSSNKRNNTRPKSESVNVSTLSLRLDENYMGLFSGPALQLPFYLAYHSLTSVQG